MDASHNDPIAAAHKAAQEHRDSAQATPLELALYALLLRRSRRVLARLKALSIHLQALDAQIPS